MAARDRHVVGLSLDDHESQYTNDKTRIPNIAVVIQAVGEPWPTSRMNDNHVYIVLVVSSDESIRVNMTLAGYDERGKGMLVWERLPYVFSRSTVREHTFAINGSLSVRRLFAHLKDLGMYRYRFSGGGSGCHYWT
jgi:hypothetical protein